MDPLRPHHGPPRRTARLTKGERDVYAALIRMTRTGRRVTAAEVGASLAEPKPASNTARILDRIIFKLPLLAWRSRWRIRRDERRHPQRWWVEKREKN